MKHVDRTCKTCGYFETDKSTEPCLSCEKEAIYSLKVYGPSIDERMNWRSKNQMNWYVYILECADGSLYTGITKDLDKRVEAHNNGTGAKYTRPRRPVTLAWAIEVEDKSTALRLEHHIKSHSRKEKLELING